MGLAITFQVLMPSRKEHELLREARRNINKDVAGHGDLIQDNVYLTEKCYPLCCMEVHKQLIRRTQRLIICEGVYEEERKGWEEGEMFREYCKFHGELHIGCYFMLNEPVIKLRYIHQWEEQLKNLRACHNIAPPFWSFG